MVLFSYRKRSFHSDTGGSTFESEVVFPSKKIFDLIFEKVISNDNVDFKGIPTKLLELYNKFVRIVEDEKLEENEKKELISVVLDNVSKEISSMKL